MGALNTKLYHLFNSYYNGTATPAQKDELFSILHSAVDDEELTGLIHQAWDALEIKDPLFDRRRSEDMLNNILNSRSAESYNFNTTSFSRYRNFKKIGLAAALTLFLGFCAYFFHNPKRRVIAKKNIARVKPAHDVLPGGNKAILTLANGKTIVLDSAQNGLLATQGNTQINKTQNGRLVYQAGKSEAAPVSINTITTPRGGQYQLVLADGSKVWLNSASSLSFPAIFAGKTREVSITGEAYFEVAKNPAKPFRVKALNSVVEVLGTHFNMMAYSDEAEMKTTLLEGSVKISSGTVANVLKPGQQAVLNKAGSIKVLDGVDVDDETAWKNGIFQFDDAGIETIMRQAARWYDVDISYEGRVPKREFTGRISRDVKASELLSMLSYTGVKFKIEDKHIIVLQ